MGFGLCEEAGLVVEPDRRMRVIGGQGVVVVEVDPKGLSYEDDVFAVRNVGAAAGAAAGLDRPGPGSARAGKARRPAPDGRAAGHAGCGARSAPASAGAALPGGSPSSSRPRPPCRAGSTSRATAPTSKSGEGGNDMDEYEQEAPRARLNARDTDAFDLGNLTFFPAPRHLSAAHRTGVRPCADRRPAAAAGRAPMSRPWPGSTRISPAPVFPDHAHLFAALVSLVGRLDLGLHLRSVRRPAAGAASTGSPPRRSTAAPSTGRSISPGTGSRRSGEACLRPCRPDGQAAGRVQPLALRRPHHLRHPAAPPQRAASPPPICAPKG